MNTRRIESSNHVRWATNIESPAGIFVATFSKNGLAGLNFPAPGAPVSVNASVELPKDISAWKERTAQALIDALNGKMPTDFPPLDLSAKTEFHQKVWEQLRAIPCGETRSYGEIAARLNRPGAARAVGAACGANPIPVLIPCHRVLAANRKLGGFSGGLDWKVNLLRREGVTDFLPLN